MFKEYENLFEEEKFNAEEFINEFTKGKSEYEINEAVVEIHKSIEKAQHEKMNLVKNHFSKFITSKKTVEKIRKERNIDHLKLELKDVAEQAKQIKMRYDDIIGSAKINIEHEKDIQQKETYLRRYSIIFNSEKNLREYFESRNYEEFIRYYKKALSQYTELKDSKYICSIWDSVNKLKNLFLDEVVRNISRKDISLDEILRYFSLYFQIKGHQEREKMENTLLVNIKVYIRETINTLEPEEIDTLFPYFIRTLKLTKKYFIEKNIIDDFFLTLNEFFELKRDSPFVALSIFLEKLGELFRIIQSELSNSAIATYSENFRVFERRMCRHYWKDGVKILKGDIKESECKFEDKIKNSYNVFSHKITKRTIESTIKKFVEYKNWKRGKKNIDYLQAINTLEDKLGSISKTLYIFNESLSSKFLNEIKMGIEKEEILAFADFKIEQGKSNFETLIQAVRIKSKIPLSFNKFIFVNQKIFLRNSVCKYFLQAYTDKKMEVERGDEEEVEKLNKHFSFLLSKIS